MDQSGCIFCLVLGGQRALSHRTECICRANLDNTLGVFLAEYCILSVDPVFLLDPAMINVHNSIDTIQGVLPFDGRGELISTGELVSLLVVHFPRSCTYARSSISREWARLCSPSGLCPDSKPSSTGMFGITVLMSPTLTMAL